jgi:hypothetical protein
MSPNLNAYRILHSELFDEVSNSSISCEAVRIIIPGARLLDVKFVDDEELICLVISGGTYLSRLFQ